MKLKAIHYGPSKLTTTTLAAHFSEDYLGSDQGAIRPYDRLVSFNHKEAPHKGKEVMETWTWNEWPWSAWIIMIINDNYIPMYFHAFISSLKWDHIYIYNYVVSLF